MPTRNVLIPPFYVPGGADLLTVEIWFELVDNALKLSEGYRVSDNQGIAYRETVLTDGTTQTIALTTQDDIQDTTFWKVTVFNAPADALPVSPSAGRRIVHANVYNVSLPAGADITFREFLLLQEPVAPGAMAGWQEHVADQTLHLPTGATQGQTISWDDTNKRWIAVDFPQGGNLSPVADPGGPYTPTVNVQFAADGSASSDPDGTIAQFDWNWGDGNESLNAGATPTHTYTTAVGSPFTVSLTVTDDQGATGTATTTATVSVPNQAPTADPGGPYTPTVNVQFAADGSASSDPDGTIAQFDWNWGDGNESLNAGATPTHTYTTAAGSPFTVTLTVTDNEGATDAVATTATVRQAPTADAGGPYTPAVNVQFAADGSASSDPDGTIAQFDWNWGDGNESLNAGATPTHTYTTAAGSPFTVTLTVTDDHGLTAQDTTTATISVGNQPPVADAGGPYTTTLDLTTTFDGSASSDPDGSIAQFDWDFGDGNTAPNAGATPTHTYAALGQYTVTLTVTDNEGGTDSATATVDIVNPIPKENALTPSASADWDIRTKVTSGANLGFTRETSYNAGTTVTFAVDTTGASVAPTQLRIYRIGHYDGTNHGRLVATVSNTPVEQTATAGISGGTPLVGDESKAVDCTGWTNTATWDVPGDAVSGLYCAIVDGTPRQQILFVVRNDSRAADIVCVIPTHTHLAYNPYGGPGAAWNQGRNLYHEGLGFSAGRSTRAFVVSRHKPNINRETYINNPLRFDYTSIDFLEEQGYDVKYIADEDLSRGLTWNGGSKMLYMQGHNEYWTDGMVSNLQTLRNSGMHMFIPAGNIHYWRVRDDVANPHLMWCYKDTHEHTEAGYDPDTGSTSSMDPVAPNWTGTWYDTRSNALSGGNYTPIRPEDTVNTMFRKDAGSNLNMTVEAVTYQNHPMWRDTTIAGGGQKVFTGVVGFEYDEHIPPADGRPFVMTSQETISLSGSYYDDNGHETISGAINVGVSFSRINVNAGVVSNTGGMNWVWALSGYHTGTGDFVDADARQATVNVLADMGGIPATLDVTLTAPTPVDLDTYGFDYTPVAQAGGPYGAESGVAVNFSSAGSSSWDGDLTYDWDFGDGNTSTQANPTHTYAADGGYTATLTVTDGSARTAVDTASVNVGVIPYDIFQGELPVDTNVDFANRYVFGTRFDVAGGGEVRGIKAHSSQAGMIAEVALYQNDGTLLGSKAVTDPGGGYNIYDFDTPISVGAGEYVAVVLMAGDVADRTTGGYFNGNTVTNGRLTATAWADADRNGRYEQSATLVFPASGPALATGSQWYHGIDVFFVDTQVAPVADAGGSYSVIGTLIVNFDASASSDFDGTIVQYDWDYGEGAGFQNNVGATPSHTYATFGNYTATVRVTDNDGLTDTAAASVSVSDSPAQFQPFFSGDATWGSQGTDTQGYVQGSFFTPTVNGSVTEIHTYETADMAAGPLAVNVYTVSPQPPYSDQDVIDCTPIGSSENLTLTGAAGWRTLTLATPVAVTAGTTYVVGCAPTAYLPNNAFVQEVATPPTISGFGTIWGASGTTIRASGLDRVRTTRYYPFDITFVAD